MKLSDLITCLAMIQLYTFFRSSAAYRVRIALNLKGLSYESIPVHLLRGGGEQHSQSYAQLNPTQLIPSLVDGDLTLGQSLAILEYLEEAYPQPALLPGDVAGRARVRGLSLAIACDIHPLNNLRVLQYLEHKLKVGEAARSGWYQHWILLGFSALETMLCSSSMTGDFCHGSTPTLADCFLVPQVANARRFDIALDDFPTICRIDAHCADLPAFAKALPRNQPDAS
jgi:maleylpyruvate isomerase